MPQPSETVSFRLSTAFTRLLRDKAAMRDESPGECARRMVIDQLTNRNEEELSDLRSKVDELRRDLALVANALLVRAGKAELREAEEWVRRNLNP